MLEKMRTKAIERLKQLNVLDNVVNDFKNGIINKSEYGMGILYHLNDEEKKMVKEFEERTGAVVFHVIYDKLVDMGDTYSLLFISKYEDDWAVDDYAYKEGFPIAWVKSNWCEEMGSIGVIPCNGGVKRIA